MIWSGWSGAQGLLRRAAVAGALAAGLLGAGVAAAATLEVTVQVPRADEGEVHIGVYAESSGFPDPDAASDGAIREVRGDAVTVVFEGLEPGRYAVAAFQDLDGSGELATNVLGIPQEPAGFSRGAMGRMGPPSFEDAAIEVPAEGAATTIELTD